MAFTTEFLAGLGIEKEVAAKIFAERSLEIEAEKANAEKIKSQLITANETIEAMTADLAKAKADGATVESLNAKIAEYEQAEVMRKQAEAENSRRASLDERFEKWQYKDKSGNPIPFTEAGRRIARLDFEKAIEAEENAGKSDDEIIRALTFDENGNARAGYFDSGVTVSALSGAEPLPSGGGADEAKIRAVMGLPKSND